MLVVDTNVIVRLIVNDDPRQSASARRLLEQHDIWIGVTVLLEAAWVIESVYELTPVEAARGLRALLGLPRVRVEDDYSVAAALDAIEKGIEFADAMHLLRGPQDAEFATFDRGLAKAGRKHRSIRLM